MRSQAALRGSRLTSIRQSLPDKIKKKNSSNKLSQSPTLASSYSQKSLFTHSYKNQPFPKALRGKLWGKKFEFDRTSGYSSEQEQQIKTVQEDYEAEGIQKKAKRLPHFKIIADQGEFISKRNRIKSEFQFRCRERCRSVQSLKLAQVVQQKKQEDELKKLQRSKMSYFKDKNQFNQRRRKTSQSDVASKAQSFQSLYIPTTSRDFPQEIEQNQAEETKSVKLSGSILTAQIQKLMVDELDSRKYRKQQVKPQQIQQIIQQKMEEEMDTTKLSKLRLSLSKFESQSEYLKVLGDEQVVRNAKDLPLDQDLNLDSLQPTPPTLSEGPTIPLGQNYQQIKQCSSSGCEDDQQIRKLSDEVNQML